VRIAFSGAHGVGKTSLLAEVHQHLPGYEAVDEPYYELLEEGCAIGDPPTADDFLAQLEHSITRISEDRGCNRLYDRCPTDFLAYLAAIKAPHTPREWLDAATRAMATLDLLVFVPIEQPDRFGAPYAHDKLRSRVDALLREILLDDSYGFDRPAIDVQGPLDARAQQVVSAIRAYGSANSWARSNGEL
jgi:predicted ATPase